MITPAEIRQKAQRKYRDVLKATVLGECEGLFPMLIRANRDPGKRLASAAQAIEQLRAGSREGRGYGYEVTWKERRSRQFGRNLFPDKITIPSLDDFMRLIGKRREHASFVSRLAILRDAFPVLEPWFVPNVNKIIKWEPDWDGLCDVLGYFREHPSPGVFARELPLKVDSKFIETHEAELRSLLELILPESAIDHEEAEFDRRFGLRPFEAMIRMRFLDPQLQDAAGIETEEFGLPVDQLRLVDWPIERVCIVENARCLLTLPQITKTLGLFGHGYRVSNFRRLPWLKGCPILYWGDIDVQGFEILSDLRFIWPQTRSLLMNEVTRESHQHLSGPGKPSRRRRPPTLESPEHAAWKWCRDHEGRIEQERLPNETVRQAIADMLG